MVLSSADFNLFQSSSRRELHTLLLLQAKVVCRQLGYSGAERATIGSHFGYSSYSKFSYDDVNCYGFEYSLDRCSHEDTNNCRPNEVAGVVCSHDGGVDDTELDTKGESSRRNRLDFASKDITEEL